MIEPSDVKPKLRVTQPLAGLKYALKMLKTVPQRWISTPLTNNNCLRHLVMAESKRSMMSSSFLNPSNVVVSPSSTNL